MATAAPQVSVVLPLATRAASAARGLLATRGLSATRALGARADSAVQVLATRGVSALPAEAPRASETQRGIWAPLGTREDGEPHRRHRCSIEK